MNLFDFILNTCEGSRRRHNNYNSMFVDYLAGSHKEGKGRIIRNSHKEIVPEFFGGWPPLSDSYEDGGLYEACMLVLFNPWRDIRGLKNGHESFGRAFVEFEQGMSGEVRDWIDHIQSYYQCGSGGVDSTFEEED